MEYIRLRKVKQKQIGGINGHSVNVFRGSDYIGGCRRKNGVVGMKKAFVFGSFIVGLWLGILLFIAIMTTQEMHAINRKALINHGLASYNQTTGKFICDICKE